MLDKDLKPRKRAGLNERTAEGETLILDRINGQIHHLNSTASYVWKQCDGSSTKVIAEKLVHAFQIDLATAERDVLVVLSEMKRMNLLETCDNLTQLGGCSQ
jgi:hypothetical protein